MQIQTDNRAVSEVLGAIFVFLLVLAVISIIQVAAIPNEAGQAEAQHDVSVKDAYENIGGAIINAAAADSKRTAEIDLGSEYNAPFPFFTSGPNSGTIQGVPVGAYGVTGMEDSEGDSINVDLGTICGIGAGATVNTDQLNYSIDYNNYRGESAKAWDATVIHEKYENSPSYVTQGDQELIKGSNIDIYSLEAGGLSTTRSEVESLTFYGESGADFFYNSATPWNLTVPTTLPSQYWWDQSSSSGLLWAQRDESLGGTGNITNVWSGITDRTIDIRLQPGRYAISCNTIGLNQPPTGNPPEEPPGGGGGGGGNSDINPNSPNGSLVLQNVNLTTDDTFSVTFVNTANTSTNITDARVNFYYYSKPGETPDPDDVAPLTAILDDQAGGSTQFNVRGTLTELDQRILIPAEQKKLLQFNFYKDAGATDPWDKANRDDYFVLTTEVDGNTSLYFVAIGRTIIENDIAPFVDSIQTREQGQDIKIDYVVSDVNGDLASIEFEVKDGAATIASGSDSSISGDEASGTLDFNKNLLTPGDPYTLIVTVTDQEGESREFSKTISR